MRDKVLSFLRDEQGLTTVEYAMAGALVAVTLALAFSNLGLAVGQVINNMTAAISP